MPSVNGAASRYCAFFIGSNFSANWYRARYRSSKGVLRHIATPVATDSYSVENKNRNFRQIQRIESGPCRHLIDRQDWHGFSASPNLPPISRNLEWHAHDSSFMVVNNANAIGQLNINRVDFLTTPKTVRAREIRI
ncbi:hypothetical protein [Burkholderia stagnalis]|uniref:hypothetical protein n=1 Tax=Burkholderia stagnalis TaxID=1503054 RepID=UPI000F582CDF|nr:hypothetical protein [Burkholderia stagnalis]